MKSDIYKLGARLSRGLGKAASYLSEKSEQAGSKLSEISDRVAKEAAEQAAEQEARAKAEKLKAEAKEADEAIGEAIRMALDEDVKKRANRAHFDEVAGDSEKIQGKVAEDEDQDISAQVNRIIRRAREEGNDLMRDIKGQVSSALASLEKKLDERAAKNKFDPKDPDAPTKENPDNKPQDEHF